MSKFKIGDMVRYADGPTALCKLISNHVGGFHAEHCLGGFLFVSEGYPNPIRYATEEDIRIAQQSQFYIFPKRREHE